MAEAIKAHLDFETASATDLRASGVARYVEDPSTLVWVFYWRLGQGPRYEWRPGYPDPKALLDHIATGGIVCAHNAAFERWVWNHVLRRYRLCDHWPLLSVRQMDCTMARAVTLALPGGLDELANVLGLTERKDMQGSALMKKMSKPRSRAPNGDYVWWNSEENLDRLSAYCAQDVEVETEVDAVVPPLPPSEQALWFFDQIINDRGVAVDLKVVQRAVKLADYARKRADIEMRRLTGGAVRKCSEVAKIVAWINEQGVECGSLRKDDDDDLFFAADISDKPLVREVVTLRRSASKTSTAKYDKMLACVCADGRMRHLLGFNVARTGRWGGRLVQPQNFPRFDHERPEEVEAVEILTGLLADESVPIAHVYNVMDLTYGETLAWLSKALRSVLIAAPGCKFIGGDYSNIEGRVNAWLAGEDWKLKAFADYDAKTGPDLYKLAYSKSFGVAIDLIKKAQRQIGKVQELALGYQGGIGAFLKMVETYNVDIFEIAKAVRAVTPDGIWDATLVGYDGATDKFGLLPHVWAALKLVVRGWRAAHPNIVQSWWDYNDAALEAVSNPGTIQYVREGRIPVRFLSDGNFLYCCLPSGRVMSYAKPTLEQTQVVLVNKNGEEYTRLQTSVRYMGVDSKTKQWGKLYLYGGKLCENIVQATSRDLLVEAMFRVEAAGYPVILTVHDEILSEPEEDFGTPEEFDTIMSQLPQWAGGLPLATGAWEDKRYVK